METENLFKNLKTDFERFLNTPKNKNYLIEREISAIERFILEKPTTQGALRYIIYTSKAFEKENPPGLT